jgi:hypothetical protein
MTDQTKPEILTDITGRYPRFELTPKTLDIYERLLSDIPAEVLRAACQEHIDRIEYYPTIAELRVLSLRILQQKDERDGGQNDP